MYQLFILGLFALDIYLLDQYVKKNIRLGDYTRYYKMIGELGLIMILNILIFFAIPQLPNKILYMPTFTGLYLFALIIYTHLYKLVYHYKEGKSLYFKDVIYVYIIPTIVVICGMFNI